MRPTLTTAAALVALTLPFGLAAAQTQQGGSDTPAQSQPPANTQPQQPATAPAQNAPLANPEQERKSQQTTTGSPSGKAGKEEGIPDSLANMASQPVLVNGRLNVPGAPQDSEAVPAKFSEKNAKLDKLPLVRSEPNKL